MKRCCVVLVFVVLLFQSGISRAQAPAPAPAPAATQTVVGVPVTKPAPAKKTKTKSKAAAPAAVPAAGAAAAGPPVPATGTAYAGTYYSVVLKPTNLPSCPCTYSTDSTALPAGLQASSSDSGLTIEGTPAATAAAVPIDVVVNGSDKIVHFVFTLTVAANPAVVATAGAGGAAAPLPLAVNTKTYAAKIELHSAAGAPACAAVTVDAANKSVLDTAKITLAADGSLTATTANVPAPVTFSASCVAGGPTAQFTIPATPAAPTPTATLITQLTGAYTSPCDFTFNDCTFRYQLIGGIEQSDLSAQNTTTEGFYYLFVRAPLNMRWGSVWFRSRYLGALSASSTANVVSAATNPSGAITATSLPQSIGSIDYVLGLEHDYFLPTPGNKGSGQFTLGLVGGFGATTPLSGSTIVNAFQVPGYGTNECTQLQQRFGPQQTITLTNPASGPASTTVAVTGGNLYGYSPYLPPPGVSAAAASSAVAPTFGCVVQPVAGTTVSTATNIGTPITAIAFSNQDRSSFLLKWAAGIRITDRTIDPKATKCSDSPGACNRIVADFTLGQDQEITGGYMRHLVFKADAVIPILNTGFYFLAASANRIEKNQDLSPLILNSLTTATSSGSASCTATSSTICVPSSSVFVLPYKQQDRDFYRIGVGIDLQTVLTKLFSKPVS